jgi:capsular polysaccharide biosynthesis protein
MELVALWRVARRRWWLIAIPTAVAALFAALTYEAPPTLWTTGLRFTAAQAPAEGEAASAAAPYEDSSYVPWLASEYLVNALTAWVTTGSFAQAVSDNLARGGVEIGAGALGGAFAADNERSVMAIYITWRNPDQLWQIAAAAMDVLVNESGPFFPQTAAQPVTVKPLDEIAVGAAPPAITARLRPLVTVGVGLAGGLALAFLVEYLDPTLHTREELEEMGFDVIAEIPRHKA